MAGLELALLKYNIQFGISQGSANVSEDFI